MSEIRDYIAVGMQLSCPTVNSCASHAEARDSMNKTIDKIEAKIFGTKKFLGDDVRLIVLPEYFMTSFPIREDIRQWREKAAIAREDELFDRLGSICRKNDLFLSGNYYEKDDNFPDIYFQSSFILDEMGQMILNYRRLNSMYSVTPHDVLDRYLEIYGYDALFPVADTKLGRLACIASEEILYPEVARCLMAKGAEVFLHSSSEIGSATLSKKNIAKRARAIENLAYVISANSAGIINGLVPDQSTDGHSQIVHYEGHVLAEALTGESIVANHFLSIRSLRQYRQTVGMKNYIARQRFELYADTYKNSSFYPPNTFLKENLPKSAFKSIQDETISNLKSKGIL